MLSASEPKYTDWEIKEALSPPFAGFLLKLFVLKQLPQEISFLKETPLHFKGKLPLIPSP